LAGRISETFPIDHVLPAPGQGALAVQCRKDDKVFLEILSQLDEPVLRLCVEAERSFLKAWGFDYDSPLAAFAEPEGAEIVLHAAHLDFGKSHRLRRVRVVGRDPEKLAAMAKTQIETEAA
ncbi:MAG: hydroxymethylbilane synthase, partial [Spirochaetia bacterium]|nr:hydroxymethylbilane synthase [Spirochaetia bacterium]